jgi:hypothetical protein
MGFRIFIQAAILVAALAGCASFDGYSLVPGKSTAAEVEATMGPPHERYGAPGGDSVWMYSRQPIGRRNFAVTVAANGVVRSVEQRLTEANLRSLVAGQTTMQQTRELLGPPWLFSRNDRMQRNVWTWKMYNLVDIEHTLHVQFSDDGLVREVLMLRDWPDENIFFRRFR